MVTLRLGQIRVPPGQRVAIEGVNWLEFEAILTELGEKRSARIAYSHGTLELMTPLPEHERAKVAIADLLKVLLEELGWEWESLGSTTFRYPEMQAGIEPDDCFYIQNYRAAIGKERIDLRIDPPPDLAIEVDVTSTTELAAYVALGVQEIWHYENRQLHIYLLQDGAYVESLTSRALPDFPVLQGFGRFLESSRSLGMSQTLREFRLWVRDRV